jgi:hypothetical protein
LNTRFFSGAEVNADKTKYMVMSRDLNTVQNGYTQIGNKSFETAEEFKYLGTTLTYENSIHGEIKSRLKSWNACYHSVQNLLSSSLLSKSVKIKIYRTIILLVVLYRCETWSLTLRGEYRLRVFKNRVLRRIFGPKRDEVTGKWRRLYNKELYALYSSPDIIQVINSRTRWAGHVTCMGEGRGAYRVLAGKPEGRIPLGRLRHRWENNLKMDLREVGWRGGGVGWTDLAQNKDRWWDLVNAVMNLRVP